MYIFLQTYNNAASSRSDDATNLRNKCKIGRHKLYSSFIPL